MQSDDEIARAVAVLRAGGLVAIPTETVYGLAADATNEAAVARIFAAKGRPPTHPLIVHLGAADWLEHWAAHVPPIAHRLAARFWPGPLTLILPRPARVPPIVTGGQPTVALRVPDHPLTLRLLRSFGSALAAPSANRFGAVSPTTAADVRETLGEAVDYVLDGGACTVGLESTILDLSRDPPRLLRPGGVPREALEEILGMPLERESAGPVRAPGQHPLHYAPRARLLLLPTTQVVDEAVRLHAEGRHVGLLRPRGEAGPQPRSGLKVIDVPGTAEAYARGFYGFLREFDRAGCEVIVAALPEEKGLGLAIADRLRRAAAPRT
ncbi:MAG: threonylcarbamoyl-AMP synthase [Xanthomonadaceae bacterium]|nr:threonylcarbamoyl-AMP synthase [Xanthomonadaceae bacterium]